MRTLISIAYNQCERNSNNATQSLSNRGQVRSLYGVSQDALTAESQPESIAGFYGNSSRSSGTCDAM